MNRLILILSTFVFSSILGFSQDTIYTVNDETIVSKVLEAMPQEIMYKKFENLNGPTYTLNKSEIKSIVYNNGSVDDFAGSEKKEKKKSSRKYPSQLIIHAGATYSTIMEDRNPTKPKFGKIFGISIEVPLDTNKYNYFDFNFVFEQKGTAYEDYIFTGYSDKPFKSVGETKTLDYISVSGSVKRYLGVKQYLFIRFGFFASYLFDGQRDGDILSLETGEPAILSLDIRDWYSRYDMGATVGTGLKIPLQRGNYNSDFIFDIKYNYGLFDINIDFDNWHIPKGVLYSSSFVFMAGLKVRL